MTDQNPIQLTPAEMVVPDELIDHAKTMIGKECEVIPLGDGSSIVKEIWPNRKSD